MLYASRRSTTPPARSLIRYAIFSKIGPPRRVDPWPRYSKGHNSELCAVGIELVTL